MPGSPADLADAAVIKALRGGRLHASGLRLTVLRAALVSRSAGGATLLVRDRLAGYHVRSANGRVVGATPARPAADHVVELRGVPGAWRIVRVSAPNATPTPMPPGSSGC